MEPIKIRAYKNKYKKSDKHPAYKGKYRGKEVAVWVELDKEGDKCLSITVKDDEERDDERRDTPARQYDQAPVDDDDLPF